MVSEVTTNASIVATTQWLSSRVGQIASAMQTHQASWKWWVIVAYRHTRPTLQIRFQSFEDAPMNIIPSGAIAGIAGASHAAAKGGETDKLSADATDKQVAAEKPAGKNELQALDAGAKLATAAATDGSCWTRLKSTTTIRNRNPKRQPQRLLRSPTVTSTSPPEDHVAGITSP